MEPALKPLELSFLLPKTHTILQAHLTFLETSIVLFLTTSTIGESSSSLAPMGSFVYAMPNVSPCLTGIDLSVLICEQRLDEKNVLSTTLYESGSSIDYATRAAKILARRTKTPAYVGCSMNFAGTTVEEEMEGLTKVIDNVMAAWHRHEAAS